MYICVGCKKEMVCDKNSVGADFGNGHVYPSDRFRCPQCGTMILATNGHHRMTRIISFKTNT
jgi:DNA-directed RNA polymerase subunit RPC12/RpoP